MSFCYLHCGIWTYIANSGGILNLFARNQEFELSGFELFVIKVEIFVNMQEQVNNWH